MAITGVEPTRGIKRAARILAGFFVVGTIGFSIIGYPEHSILDAVYMAVITLTTVGYGEVIDLTNDPGGRIFTIIWLLMGYGTILYFMSSVTAFIVEGTLDKLFWRRRMIRKIANLKDHYVVCGGGHTGEHVVRELIETRRPFVLIEARGERVEELYRKFPGFAAVIGDATDDEVLLSAGIERAKGLVSCVEADKDNLVVTFSARNINPNLRIVSRSADDRGMAKQDRAGADAVVCPSRIGGLRLVSELVRPAAVSFLDVMLRDKERALRVEDTEIEQGSMLTGVTVGELRARHVEGFLLLAVRQKDGEWEYDPPDDRCLRSGMSVVFMSNPAAREAISMMAAAPTGDETE